MAVCDVHVPLRGGAKVGRGRQPSHVTQTRFPSQPNQYTNNTRRGRGRDAHQDRSHAQSVVVGGTTQGTRRGQIILRQRPCSGLSARPHRSRNAFVVDSFAFYLSAPRNSGPAAGTAVGHTPERMGGRRGVPGFNGVHVVLERPKLV